MMSGSHCFWAKSCVVSHIGRVRINQEDNFLLDNGRLINFNQREIQEVRVASSSNEAVVLYAIADGMGGHKGGEVASYIAMEGTKFFGQNLLARTQQFIEYGEIESYLNDLNKKIVVLSEQDMQLSNMGTTINGIIAYKDHAISFNLGDSKTYTYDGKRLNQISKDHTEGQRMLDLGLLTEDELHNFKYRHVVNKYLGCSMKMRPEIKCISHKHQKIWYMLCTDGLSDLVNEDEIEQTLAKFYKQSNIKGAQDSLLELALNDTVNRSGGRDNITIMLIEVNGDLEEEYNE